MQKPTVLSLAAVAALLLAPGPAGAAPSSSADSSRAHAAPVVLQSAQAAPVPDAGEAVLLDDGLLQSLTRLDRDESVSASWPVAPGRRISVVLTRRDVYAADARIVSIDRGREVPVPRSRLRFFWGAAPEGAGADATEATRVLVTWDPDRKAAEGVSWSGSAVYRVRPDPKSPGAYRLSRSAAEEAEAPVPAWTCGQEELAAPPSSAVESSARRPDSVRAPLLSGSYTATLAIDTDNALLSVKFGNNVTLAANYIASLVAAMNAQTYNPDFTTLSLFQGFTILRPSTTPDPYIAGSGGNADGDKLNDFTNYWNANYSGITRALALMISGKQPGGFSASGIAWIGNSHSALLCNSSLGYSFNQIFTGTDDFPDIGKLVAHELGHNLGAPHTHCEGLDQCWNLEPCYTGPTSCPVGGPGTLMSYCHLTSCGSTPHFHPFQQAYVNTNLAGAVGVCVFPTISGPAVPLGVQPGSGPAAGSTGVTVTGSNFSAGAAVTVNGVAAAVTGATPTQITATTGKGTPGRGNVVIKNPGQTAATLSNAYFYYFNDVLPANPFFPFVNKMLLDGVSSGCTPGNYCPSSSVTRGQMAVFLLRSKGGAAYTPPACTGVVFSDVPCSNGFATWINELAARNITAGCGFGAYCPNDPVTRAQMAVFLLRTSDGSSYTPPACTTAPFFDVPCSSGFAPWIQELVARGVTVGCGSGNYCPESAVSRQQMAVFLVTTFVLP